MNAAHTPLRGILLARNGELIQGYGGVALIVSYRYWPVGTSMDDVLSGAAPAERVTATQDGRRADLTGYHVGPEAESVYVERYAAGRGRIFHGWVDSVSRRITQTG